MKFDENNKIRFGQDHQFHIGVPSEVDFKVENFTDGRFVLTAYGYGQLEPHDQYSYGNGKIYPYNLTEEQNEEFKKHAQGPVLNHPF